MHLKTAANKWALPSAATVMSLAISQAWAQVPAQPATELPAAASSSMPPEPGANAQVLQNWQAQTGQAAWVNDDGKLEFHGAITVDVYGNSKNIPSGNPALSPLPQGTFGRVTFQGDVRTTSAEGDVTYLQGTVSSSSDRSIMPRYNAQINSLQGGRAGPGYQIAVGDVVAGFSGLSSNLGLRGLLAARQTERFTFTGFAGTVAESWEALLNAGALDGLAARTRYSREVFGGKTELQFDDTTSGFVTLQSWRDRTGSANLAPGSTALAGTAASVGAKYTTQKAGLTLEAARSSQQDVSVGGAGFGPVAGVAGPSAIGTGSALTADGTYRFDALGLRAGYHNLSTGFASLAQTVAPGVREWYVGGDWTVTPQLTWSTDLRHALSRIAATAFSAASANELDSLTNRLNYNVASLPGLILGLNDTRNKGKDAQGNTNTNVQTTANVGYAFDVWNTQASVGTGQSRNPATPLSDSNTQQWQFGLGRSFTDTQIEGITGWSASAQFSASGQSQRLVNIGTQVRTLVVGVTGNLQSKQYGNLSAGLQRQTTTQSLAGAATLVTTSFTLDWSRALTRQWTVKTYARINNRNHGDFIQQADERVVGAQGVYQW